MTKQIILHMGFHKTASTSIQFTLASNREILLKSGFFYPDFKIGETGFNNHSIPLRSIFQPDLNPKDILDYNQKKSIFTSLLDSYLQSNQSLIISGEDISFFSLKNLQNFKATLENHHFQIRPIVFIREPVSNFSSAIQETFKSTKNTIGNIIKKYKPTSLLKMNNLKKIFPQIEFYSFDQACAHLNGPVGFFIQLLGLDHSLFEIHKVNESISMPAARLFNVLSEYNNISLEDNLDSVRSNKDKRLISSIKGPKFTLLKSEIEPHYKNFLAEREAIEKNTNVVFSSSPSLESYTELFTWEETSILSFIALIPKLNHSLLYQCYDYFYDLYNQKQLDRKYLNQIGNAIEKAIRAKEILTQSQIELLQQTANILTPKNPKMALQLFNLVRPASPDKDILKKIQKLERNLSWKKKLPNLLNWLIKRTKKANLESA